MHRPRGEAPAAAQPFYFARNPVCFVSFNLVSVQIGSKPEFLKAPSKLETAKLPCLTRPRPLLSSLLRGAQRLFPWELWVPRVPVFIIRLRASELAV